MKNTRPIHRVESLGVLPESFGELTFFLEQRSEVGISHNSVWHFSLKNKTWGGEKAKRACEKGTEGADKAPAPPPQIKSPMGPCDPLAAKRSRLNPGNGGDQTSAQEAHPLALTRAGAGVITRSSAHFGENACSGF